MKASKEQDYPAQAILEENIFELIGVMFLALPGFPFYAGKALDVIFVEKQPKNNDYCNFADFLNIP